MKILFIGNSHTYYNDLPQMVKELFAATGVKVHVTMSTEGGKCLSYHCDRKDVKFNIRYGEYDAVVLQGKATDFDPADFLAAGMKLYENALSTVPAHRVLYMIWAHRHTPGHQSVIRQGYTELAKAIGADIAPAGEVWYQLIHETPELIDQFFRPDGNHATPLGSYLAATTLFYTLSGRKRPINVKEGDEPSARLGIDPALCRRIHKAACALANQYRYQS